MMKRRVLSFIKPFITPINKIILSNYFKGVHSVQPLSEKRVLLLAPHVDDETIGAGGTLKAYADLGAETHVLFLTDGSGSNSNEDARLIVKQRKEEAKEVQKLLKITSIDFLDEKDGELRSTSKVQQRLKQKIESIRPEVIFIPVFVDCHPDHIATSHILLDTLSSIDSAWKNDIKIRLYEINTLLPKEEINCIVDITKYMDVKQATVNVFASQAIDFDGFMALSSLKSNLVENHAVKAVETFMELSVSELDERIKNNSAKEYSKYFKQVNKEATLLYAIFKNLKYKEKVYQHCASTKWNDVKYK
ncbi:PIG-L deacetylase family protein [Bacillus alkalisoli]|uniref:PIG-L deacetylase family protein n=1 Tax=Bacillus alkalisoli TaxID=2011008 RepID=UPI000C233DB5|nr:PIG-L deacetylase family protein [Bacillus alkalisoli]